MSARVFDLQCSPCLQRHLCCAIRLYVATEYPPGVADCALAAREALLDVAQRIETVCQSESRVTLSRRLRTLLRIAVNFYCAQTAPDAATAREALLAALEGEAVTDEQLGGLPEPPAAALQ